MDISDRPYWLAFSSFPGVGPIRFKLLLNYFGTAKKAWEATANDLLKIQFGEVLTRRLEKFRLEFSVEGYANRVKEKGVSVLLLPDAKYPTLLSQIEDAPFVLYIKGKKIENWDIQKSIGIVGTRQITSYGKEVTTIITRDLVKAGVTIVSGLALGVDAVAHEVAITTGGKTIAVLGCGVDCCNPQTNTYIYKKIIDGNGIVISEMPLSLEPSPSLFPARNRIISGLSQGIVVTEGAKKSGSLITASYAGTQGREVFGVPGPITSPLSLGPGELIKKGAKIVTEANDILDEFGWG